ncbi:MAG TPA: hypothetical protein PLX97_09415 [Gemmatales bacterium]|nr:hypothetical protein [Gemmatales bacterium]
MKTRRAWLSVSAALVTGVALGWFMNARQPAYAGGSTDRHDDFVMATGPVNQTLVNSAQFQSAALDGLWVLDYKSGKLQASAINRKTGKMSGISEVDLVKEFEIAPRANVHFMMTTGSVIKGQSVLYLMETTTGKLGVYSMSSDNGNSMGSQERILIRKHDMVSTRSNSQAPAASLLQSTGGGGAPANLQQNQSAYPNPQFPSTPMVPGNNMNNNQFQNNAPYQNAAPSQTSPFPNGIAPGTMQPQGGFVPGNVQPNGNLGGGK